MPDETSGFESEPVIDMGYLSLPADVQQDIEQQAAPARFVTGVHRGWHAIDAAGPRYCPDHAGAECGEIVRPARLDDGSPRPWDPSEYPAAFDPCPECTWHVAAVTGFFTPAFALLRKVPSLMLAHDTAMAILDANRKGCGDSDDPAMLQLLAAVTRHAPSALVAIGCAEGDCGHPDGQCPTTATACRQCSLRDGPWAGEYEGQYRPECTIPAPCAPLLAIAEHFGVKP